MNGSDIFVESLLKEGVDTIFGHPGGAILPLNDALYSGRIRHILTRHEQGGRFYRSTMPSTAVGFGIS
jgi:acetolactate synthase I/II/III large subunit